jgi:hypothetical protein
MPRKAMLRQDLDSKTSKLITSKASKLSTTCMPRKALLRQDLDSVHPLLEFVRLALDVGECGGAPEAQRLHVLSAPPASVLVLLHP